MAQVWVHSIFRKTDVHFLPIQKSYAVFWAILIRFRKQLVMNRVYVWVALFDLSSWLWRIWRPALVDCAKCDFMTFANQSTNRKLHCMWTLPMPVLAVAFFSTHRVQQRKRRLHLQRILNSVLPPFCAMRWKTTKRCWFMVLGIFVDTWGSSIRSLSWRTCHQMTRTFSRMQCKLWLTRGCMMEVESEDPIGTTTSALQKWTCQGFSNLGLKEISV